MERRIATLPQDRFLNLPVSPYFFLIESSTPSPRLSAFRDGFKHIGSTRPENLHLLLPEEWTE
ncbi:MAG: hypothetical protein IJP80_02965 [Bacteroidales bacterium]|nr:hypothetical protein [Bacteroidales bacterium]